MGQMMIFINRMFWGKFYMILSVFSCLEMFKQTLGSNLGIGKSKLGFWGENGSFPEPELSELATHSQWGVGCEQQGLPGANSQCNCELHMTVPPVSHSCVFFPHFCFDLVFDVNMEVVDNLVIFPMVLVWLENDSWILSYEENALRMA
jgi:hypothetical protein